MEVHLFSGGGEKFMNFCFFFPKATASLEKTIDISFVFSLAWWQMRKHWSKLNIQPFYFQDSSTISKMKMISKV